MHKKCLVCGVVFYKKVNESNYYWETKKYCSIKCSLVYNAITKQPNRYFYPKNHTPWNKNKKYSKEMYLRLNMEGLKIGRGLFKGKKLPQLQGELNPNWKPKINVECSNCKKILKLQPNQVRNRNFCNRKCWALGTRGKGSPVFKGELAIKPLRDRIMELPEYDEWRAKILERDNWVCQICGFRNKGRERRQMEVDHLKRYYHIVKENGIATVEQARNCKALWDINNGRTVCRPCHRKSDTYGTTGLKKQN